ncbi:MAG: peptidylprolyl isomerase [Rhodoferax sp.]
MHVSAQSPASDQKPATYAALVATGSYGLSISAADFQAELSRMTPTAQRKVLESPQTLRQIAETLVIRRALAFEAERDGLLKDPVIQSLAKTAWDRALSEARLQRLDVQNQPTEAALEAYARDLYKANPKRFEVPVQTRASHILIANTGPDSLKQAKELLAQIKSGANFSDLAKQYSKDPGSAAKGGDLGYFGPGQMVRPFEDAVNQLKNPGDLSEPVETQFGYHIIRLDDRKPAGVRPFDEVKAELIEQSRQALLNEARMAKVNAMTKEVKIDEKALKALVDALSASK